MKNESYATIEEIVEYGLDRIPDEQTITINLKDFMYIYRVLEEYMRFFHNHDHYQKIEDVYDFLGTASSGGAFQVLNNALYKKIIKGTRFSQEIEDLEMADTFSHPLFPKYYQRIYEESESLSEEEIADILKRDNIDELMSLPLNVGENHPDWRFAQELCIALARHENADVRANAILGLAYIARTKKELDREIVLPVILKEYKENTKNTGIIEDALDDIALFLKWDIIGCV
jgi:hypothetical protein